MRERGSSEIVEFWRPPWKWLFEFGGTWLSTPIQFLIWRSVGPEEKRLWNSSGFDEKEPAPVVHTAAGPAENLAAPPEEEPMVNLPPISIILSRFTSLATAVTPLYIIDIVIQMEGKMQENLKTKDASKMANSIERMNGWKKLKEDIIEVCLFLDIAHREKEWCDKGICVCEKPLACNVQNCYMKCYGRILHWSCMLEWRRAVIHHNKVWHKIRLHCDCHRDCAQNILFFDETDFFNEYLGNQNLLLEWIQEESKLWKHQNSIQAWIGNPEESWQTRWNICIWYHQWRTAYVGFYPFEKHEFIQWNYRWLPKPRISAATLHLTFNT